MRPPVGQHAGVVLVDAMNVVGHRPDGWWRDRDGAVVRLAERLGALQRAGDGPFTLVADGGGEALVGRCATHGIPVLLPRRRGRGAADERIVQEVAGAADPTALVVVTADRALAARVRALGAGVARPGDLLRRLDA